MNPYYTTLALLAVCFACFKAVGMYGNVVLRDPFDFNHEPSKISWAAAYLIICGPFLLLAFDVNLTHSILYNAVLSLAISMLVIPALIGNRTGPGITWLQNMIEKSVAGTMFATLVSFLSTVLPLSWFALLVIVAYMAFQSRYGNIFLNVQDENQSKEWNENRCAEVMQALRRAQFAYLFLAIALALALRHSYIGANTWNKGAKQLWAPVRTAIFGDK